jgi:ketosteroid isomerase-like protein
VTFESSDAEAARIVGRYWDCINSGKVDNAVELLDKCGIWWSSLTGDVPAAKMAAAIPLIYDLVPITVTILGTYESGDAVAVELSGRRVFSDGTVYEKRLLRRNHCSERQNRCGT